jgi:hypothetical protein
VINRDLTISGRMPQKAILQISGGAGCDVTITVTGTSVALIGATLADSNGVTISSGSRARLSGTGTFTFRVGTSQFVGPTTNSLGGTISIRVDY